MESKNNNKKDVVYYITTIDNKLVDVEDIRKPGKRIGFIDNPKTGEIGKAINEPRGWKIEENIWFLGANHYYVEYDLAIDEVINMVFSDYLNIHSEDRSLWARDFRTVVGYYIENYWNLLRSHGFDATKGLPDTRKLEESMNYDIFNGMVNHDELFRLAEKIKPHSEEDWAEIKAEQNEIVWSSEVQKREHIIEHISNLEIMEAKNNNKNGMNVIENKVIECEVTEESRKAYGRPSVNEAKGWKLDHVIPFDFYHNAYIKSRASIDELVKMVQQECNISPDDTSSWAKDIRTIIKYSIEHFDELLEENESTPDEENDNLSECWIGDGIELQHEAFWVADDCVPHTFEEFKAEQIREGYLEDVLKLKGMTEEEFKAALTLNDMRKVMRHQTKRIEAIS